MPRQRSDLDSTFLGRHRASFLFRQDILNLTQASIFAHLMDSRENANSDSCAVTHPSGSTSAEGHPHPVFPESASGTKLLAGLLCAWRALRTDPRTRGGAGGQKFRMNIKQLLDLSGRVAIITGGSVGLGRQMAEGLAEMGANLVLCARKKERCERAADELKQLGIKALGFECDVKNPDQVRGVVEETHSQFGRIDILINNAGTAWGAPVEHKKLEHWNK